MRAKLLLVLVAGVVVAADAPKDAAKADLKKMQGTWQAVQVTYNGKEHPGLTGGKLKFVIKGDVVTVEAEARLKKEYAKLKFTLDPSTKPGSLDIGVLGGSQKGSNFEGLYELKGDELKFCAKILGMDRPTKFASPAGQSIALVVLKRDKK
jgi:uncharacterized protein (TIGR03067 family)